MFCKNCGNKLADTAKFCPKCGTKQEPKVKTEQEAKAEARVDAIAENVGKTVNGAKEAINEVVGAINSEETRAAVKGGVNATKEVADEIGEFAEAAGQRVAGGVGAKITEKTGVQKPFKILLPIVALLLCIGVYFGFFHEYEVFEGAWVDQDYKVKNTLRVCEVKKNGDAYVINLYTNYYSENKTFVNKQEVEDYGRKVYRAIPNRFWGTPSRQEVINMGNVLKDLPRPNYDYKYIWKQDSVQSAIIGVRNKNIMTTTNNYTMVFDDKTKTLQLSGIWGNGKMIKLDEKGLKAYKDIRQLAIKDKLTKEYQKRDETYNRFMKDVDDVISTGTDRSDVNNYNFNDRFLMAKLGKIEFEESPVPAGTKL